MGTTADKLTYLNNTKVLLKDRLNSLGATISSSTTFRNYLTWLDTFYGEVSDKTDIATNGIVGRTNQSGTPTPESPQAINNLTGNVTYTITTNESIKNFTIPLGDIELAEIDTYQDRIYLLNNKWYLEKQIGKVVLNGSESWNYYSTADGNLFRTTFSQMLSGDKLVRALCNNFKSVAKANRTNNTLSGDGQLLDFIYNDYSSTSAWKNWLSTHNTILYYVLNTTTTTEITTSNYPELYAALKEVEDYLVAYKINNEFILGASSPTISY